MTIREYGFQDRLAWSSGVAVDETVESILLDNIPGAVMVGRSHVGDDRQGTDYWVYRNNLPPLSVDLKNRSDDPIVSFGSDDLALEIWSVEESGMVGWTRDANKRTDYVLWHFQPTSRWVLVPFPMLCGVFQRRLCEWEADFKVARQRTDGRYHSVCVFVPRKTLWRALYEQYGGEPAHA